MSTDIRTIDRYLPSRWWGWILLWWLIVLSVVSVGALLGAVLFPLVGSIIRMDLSLAVMARNGVFDGGFYALIWAPGLAFVLCVMAAHRKRRIVEGKFPNPLDTED